MPDVITSRKLWTISVCGMWVGGGGCERTTESAQSFIDDILHVIYVLITFWISMTILMSMDDDDDDDWTAGNIIQTGIDQPNL